MKGTVAFLSWSLLAAQLSPLVLFSFSSEMMEVETVIQGCFQSTVLFSIYPDKVSHQEAFTFCEERDSRLATVDIEELSFITRLVDENTGATNTIVSLWITTFVPAKLGVLDEDSLHAEARESGCLQLVFSGIDEAVIAAPNCSLHQGFVCEKNAFCAAELPSETAAPTSQMIPDSLNEDSLSPSIVSGLIIASTTFLCSVFSIIINKGKKRPPSRVSKKSGSSVDFKCFQCHRRRETRSLLQPRYCSQHVLTSTPSNLRLKACSE